MIYFLFKIYWFNFVKFMRFGYLFSCFDVFFYLYCLFVGEDFFFFVIELLGSDNWCLFGLCCDEDIYYYFGEV